MPGERKQVIKAAQMNRDKSTSVIKCQQQQRQKKKEKKEIRKNLLNRIKINHSASLNLGVFRQG